MTVARWAKASRCGAIVAHLGQGTLDADELGPVRLAVLVQPVGVHQPWPVGVRVGEDQAQEGEFVVGHWVIEWLGGYPTICQSSSSPKSTANGVSLADVGTGGRLSSSSITVRQW